MVKCTTTIALLVIFYYASGLSLPSEFEICKRSDPKRNECLKLAIQQAISILTKPLPEFNMDSISSIKIPSLTIGAGTGAVHVVQNYKNVVINNIQSVKVEKIESLITDTEFKLIIDTTIEELDWKAQYNFNGKVLVLPIVGDGDCTIILKNTTTQLTLHGEMFEKKGKKYVEIKTGHYSQHPGKVYYDFTNLFGGDAILGNQINALLNENWKEIYFDVAPGYEEALFTVLKAIANRIFTKVPYDEIFPH